MNYTRLKQWAINPKIINQQRVILRADLNAPLSNIESGENFKLKSILSTINFIQKHHGTVVLTTHLARPQGTYNPHYSTQILIPWFAQQGYTIQFCPDIDNVAPFRTYDPTILLLENLRFYKGEQTHDPSFAAQLARWGTCYVNDAFGLIHRNDISITLLPELFDASCRFLGPLMLNEIKHLDPLVTNPQKPFLIFIGGGKLDTKFAFIESLMDRVSDIFVCPALSFTFLKAAGYQTGRSLIDAESLKRIATIEELAKKHSITLHLPVDYLIAHETKNGALRFVDFDKIPQDSVGIAIGPKTLKAWTSFIDQAKTIFFNGAMGFIDLPATLQPLHELLIIIARSSAFSVVGGGESVTAVMKFKLEDQISYLSTGGGSTLAYIAQTSLPGLKAYQ